ncbi:MAG: ADP-ribosylation factor-like protein [Candidatus Freyarchaeota archaeon]
MMEQSFERNESRADRIKVLVMGPHAAGKTAILRQTIYGFKADQLRDILPTILIDVPPETKKGKYLCRFFECGGQERFFEEYHRPENERNIFSKVNIFIFVVDSAREELFPFAHKELWRALIKLSKYSPKALSIVFAHKQDLSEAFSPGEVMDLLISPPGRVYPTKLDFDAELVKNAEKIAKRTVCYGTSIEEPNYKKGDNENVWIKADEAIMVTLQIYSKFIQKFEESIEAQESEGDTSRRLTQSMMGLVVLNSAKVLRELGERVLNIMVLRGEDNNVMMVNVTDDFSLLVILPIETDVELGYALYTVSETAKKIKEIL